MDGTCSLVDTIDESFEGSFMSVSPAFINLVESFSFSLPQSCYVLNIFYFFFNSIYIQQIILQIYF